MLAPDRPPVLVWRPGEALPAAEVDAVVEVAARPTRADDRPAALLALDALRSPA
ncbi:MAG TPA: hypothetical protein VMM12_08315 [Longimicrobiales bacterium]|nr:hypothetical protein [Longimicrobiales bacterium]